MTNKTSNPEVRKILYPTSPEVLRLIRVGFWRLWLRFLGWGGIGLYSTVLVVSVLAWRSSWEHFEQMLFLGTSAVLGPFVCLFVAFQFWTMRRSFSVKSNRKDPPELALGYSEQGIDLWIGNEYTLVPWETHPHLWQFPDCWMFLTPPHNFAAVPWAAVVPTFLLNRETQELIADQIRKHGGKIAINPGLGEGLMFKKPEFWQNSAPSGQE